MSSPDFSTRAAHLERLHPKLIDLSLDRLSRLLERLGNPQRHLPPVLHVAGTNGKGSVCAYLRAIAEAGGKKVHVMTSPHLLSPEERFRVSGNLITSEALSALLDEIEAVNQGQPITLFEILTAAGFLAFARSPADLTLIETGLGGEFDATNLVDGVLGTFITPISFDHQDFLGDSLTQIAHAKAGILRRDTALFCSIQPKEALKEIERVRSTIPGPVFLEGRDFGLEILGGEWQFERTAPSGLAIKLPAPGLAGEHQYHNAALAVMGMVTLFPDLPRRALTGIKDAHWPGRLQKLEGKLASFLPPDWEIYADGAHNPAGAAALGRVFAQWKKEEPDQPLYLLLGLKKGKNAAEILKPLRRFPDDLFIIAEPKQHIAQPVEEIVQTLEKAGITASIGPNARTTLEKLKTRPPGKIIIAGSLYLVGEILRQDGFSF